MRLFTRSLWGMGVWQEQATLATCPLPLGGGEIRLSFDKEAPDCLLYNNQSIPLNGKEFVISCPEGSIRRHVFTAYLPGGRIERVEVSSDANLDGQSDLLRDLADFDNQLRNWQLSGPPTADSLWSALQAGSITLLRQEVSRTAINMDFMLGEIQKGLPELLKICHRPRLHLFTDEAIRPVGTVRRTGPAAIKHLARHSEHWQTKTFMGLRPARLLAQVVEDDWELYENRFVITLMRRIEQHLDGVKAQISNDRIRYRQKLNLMRYSNSFLDIAETQASSDDLDLIRYSNFAVQSQSRILQLLLPNVQEDSLDSRDLDLQLLQYDLQYIDSQLSLYKNSPFFARLRKCASVLPPIKPTNILKRDVRYRALFTLWGQLNEREHTHEQGGDGALPADLTASYSRYSQVMLLTALYASGFRPADPSQFLMNDASGDFQAQGTYSCGLWSVKITVKAEPDALKTIHLQWHRSIENTFPLPPNFISLRASQKTYKIADGQLVFHDTLTPQDQDDLRALVTNPKEKWKAKQWWQFIEKCCREAAPREEFDVYLIPLLMRLDPRRVGLEQVTEQLLSEALKFANYTKATAIILLSPSTMSWADENSVQQPKILHRLRSHGEVYTEEDSAKWGGFRVGMLPIGREHFNSLSRMIRLVHLHTIRRDLEARRWPNDCPVCRHTKIRKHTSGHSFYCLAPNCEAEWGLTTCSSDVGCGQSFAWVRPRKEHKLLLASGDEVDFGTWLEMIEDQPHPVSGMSSIPSYCEASSESRASYPICPHCGRCAGFSALSERCLRCEVKEISLR